MASFDSPLLTFHSQSDARGLRNVQERMDSSPGLREQMRTPVLMLVGCTTDGLQRRHPEVLFAVLSTQIAIATHRHEAEDAGDECASGGVSAGEQRMGSLPVAPGGPSDVQLDDIDTRSPVAGLYVRLERLLAKQVCYRRGSCVRVQLNHSPCCTTGVGRTRGSVHNDGWRAPCCKRTHGTMASLAKRACTGCPQGVFEARCGQPYRRSLCISNAESLPYPPLLGATRVEWPTDASLKDRALLRDARVVAADSSGGLEFPHRSIQEYFCAIAVHVELANGRAPADAHAGAVSDLVLSLTAWDTLKSWNNAKLPGVPRDVILAVLLSDAADDDLKQWALTSTDWGDDSVDHKWGELQRISARVSLTAAGSTLPPDVVCYAQSDPANDVLRHLTMALLYRPAPGMCDRIVTALGAGCEAATFCDFLGACAPLLPIGCAATLAVRLLFEMALSVFWDLDGVVSVDTVQMLGHKFWSAADATTGGALIDRALTVIRTALPPMCSGRPSDSAIARACTAVAIVGSVSRMSTPEALVDVHSVIALAASSSIDALASEATFASTVLEPLPGSSVAIEGVRERLLALARPPPSRGASTFTVRRAAIELGRRFAGDSVVHAALKADAKPLRGRRMTPFAEACAEGPGIVLISSEIACTLFEWLEPVESTRLAMRMWDARGDSDEAVAAGFAPIHVAASRARTDFITVYLSQESVDVEAAVNVESASGFTPLGV